MVYPLDVSSGAPGPSPTLYRLRVEGRLDELAFDYVDDLTLALAIAPTGRAITTLTCELTTQEELVGLINLLHDFGLRLVLVERVDGPPLHGQPAEQHCESP
jgi:hypothetical protein